MLSRLIFRLLGGLSAGLLVACHANAPTDEAAGPPPRAQVQVVTVATQSLTQYRTFPATSTYPRKSTVTAPVAAYVTGVRVRLGERFAPGSDHAALLKELEGYFVRELAPASTPPREPMPGRAERGAPRRA